MNILVYGAGVAAQEFVTNALMHGDTIVGIVDGAVARQGKPFKPNISGGAEWLVMTPNSIGNIEFDKIMVCVGDPRSQIEIVSQLGKMDIASERIEIFVSVTDLDYPAVLARSGIMNGIDGDFAECGVYTGDFAVRLNSSFPERRLWLFDTFEGFAENDKAVELRMNPNAKFQDFSSTSIKCVRKRLLHPENVIFRQGWFPESASGLENVQFAFVRLDMDLYQPTLAGLKLFWKQMSIGGMILVDDYKASYYSQVSKAIDDFEMYIGYKIPKCPVSFHPSILLIKDS